MISIDSCPKGYTTDLDKVLAPADTAHKAESALRDGGCAVLEELLRVDKGRLGIPVYMSVCTRQAGKIMPSSKQMGKGSSPDQARASALMELVERYSFFRFWQQKKNMLTWSEAEKKFSRNIMPIELIAASTGEDLSPDTIRRLMDLVPWRFAACTAFDPGSEYFAPVDWFRMLNEFNGSSAGNTPMESILQGACELVERHVCALIASQKKTTSTINPESLPDGPVHELYSRFTTNGINIILKDFSLDMPIPTVGAVAWDPETFPDKSDIVFTAGTATSPEKAVIRALTEVAQLAAEFDSGKKYEPSGLPKPACLEELDWLKNGQDTNLINLPDISTPDIGTELSRLSAELHRTGFCLHTLDLTCPEINMPAHYNFIPGFCFRERSPSASIGMFVGKRIVEELPADKARNKLNSLSEICPGAHYLPFQYGLLALQENNTDLALADFLDAAEVQNNVQEKALALFYSGYTLSLQDRWPEVKNQIQKAIALDDGVKEYHNLLGVALFREKLFEEAAGYFQKALDLDSASAVDMANLGLCCKQSGDQTRAVSLLSAALEIDPTLEFAHRELLKLVYDTP